MVALDFMCWWCGVGGGRFFVGFWILDFVGRARVVMTQDAEPGRVKS